MESAVLLLRVPRRGIEHVVIVDVDAMEREERERILNEARDGIEMEEEVMREKER